MDQKRFQSVFFNVSFFRQYLTRAMIQRGRKYDQAIYITSIQSMTMSTSISIQTSVSISISMSI